MAIKYQANSDFLMREIGDDMVLVPINHTGIFENSMLSLNRPCAFLWKVFQVPCSAEEAIEEAKKNFSGDDDVIAGDVMNFINEYIKYGLLIKKEGEL